ncbi:hypothetical protein ACFSZS_04615 [Seohaeicola zhoushanensis]
MASELRGHLGLTNEEFAALIGLSVEDVDELEQMRAPAPAPSSGNMPASWACSPAPSRPAPWPRPRRNRTAAAPRRAATWATTG